MVRLYLMADLTLNKRGRLCARALQRVLRQQSDRVTGRLYRILGQARSVHAAIGLLWTRVDFVIALGQRAPVPVGFVACPFACSGAESDARGCSENTYPESWGRGFIAVRLAGLVGFRQALDVALLQQFLHPILFLRRIADQFPPPPRLQP
jgi:hypothetical protein